MSPDDTVVIEKIPNKPSIRYDVHVMPKNVEEILSPVITDIAGKETRAKKTIIFCRTYSDFNEISTVIISALYNRGLTHLLTQDSNVCQMFSSSTEEKVKNEILSSFTDPQSSLRVVVATIAFGMGLDAPNVENMALLTVLKPTYRKLVNVDVMDVILLPLCITESGILRLLLLCLTA